MKCTSSGKIIYKRPKHEFSWADVDRIVKSIRPPFCGNIAILNAAARTVAKIIEGVSECPKPVRYAFFFAMLALIGRQTVLEWLGPLDGTHPEDPKFGGAGVSGDILREKEDDKKITLNR